MKTRKIRTALYNVLPGEKAHALMAPRPKYIEGIEGVHPCPPVNSAILALIVPFENELLILQSKVMIIFAKNKAYKRIRTS